MALPPPKPDKRSRGKPLEKVRGCLEKKNESKEDFVYIWSSFQASFWSVLKQTLKSIFCLFVFLRGTVYYAQPRMAPVGERWVSPLV